MDTDTSILGQTTLTATASGAGNGYTVQLQDRSGANLGASDATGAIRDGSGQVVATAAAELPGRRDRPLEARLAVTGPAGEPLGVGRVTKYGIGPRSRYVHMAVDDASGSEVARVERRDKDANQLDVHVGDAVVGSVTISTVKLGFLKKARVHEIQLDGTVPASLRPLLMAALVRQDALLRLVTTAASRD